MVAALLLLCGRVAAQDVDTVDFKRFVRDVVSNEQSAYYYPKLLEKVRDHPAELSTEDCFYLYYGGVFQSGLPMLAITAPGRTEFDRAVQAGNCRKVLQLGAKLLERNPTTLNVLLHMAVCIRDNQIPDAEFAYEQRFRNLLEAILSTGDGRSMQTAIRIADMEDDYVIKGVLGFLGGKESQGFDGDHAYSIWEKGGQKLYFEDIFETKPYPSED